MLLKGGVPRQKTRISKRRKMLHYIYNVTLLKFKLILHPFNICQKSPKTFYLSYFCTILSPYYLYIYNYIFAIIMLYI